MSLENKIKNGIKEPGEPLKSGWPGNTSLKE